MTSGSLLLGRIQESELEGDAKQKAIDNYNASVAKLYEKGFKRVSSSLNSEEWTNGILTVSVRGMFVRDYKTGFNHMYLTFRPRLVVDFYTQNESDLEKTIDSYKEYMKQLVSKL